MAQGVMCLPCMHEELSSDPQTYSNMGAMRLCNPCIPTARREAKTGEALETHRSASLTNTAVHKGSVSR